jgi:hypothetical protein
LTTVSPAGLFSLITTAITSLTNRLTRFGAGTITGAIVNSTNAGLLTLQQQNEYQVAICRAATSNGPQKPGDPDDLASFVADYYLDPPRMPGVYAGGSFSTAPLTCGKFQPVSGSPLFIPAFAANQWPPAPGASGTIIQTKVGPGSQPVALGVVGDVTNPNYNATLGGYTIPIGGTTVVTTIKALVIGTGSNLLAGSLSAPDAATVVTPVGIDFTLQLADITNGVDPETDPQLRARFQKYISSLCKGTSNAIDSVVMGVQAGLSYTNNDRLDEGGNPKGSWFTIVVDDSSGAISPSTLAAIVAAINGTNNSPPTPARAEGIGFAVIAPNNLAITIAIVGTIIQPGFDPTTARAALQAALIAYVNANGVGGSGYGGVGGTPGVLSYLGILETIASFVGTGVGKGLVYEGSVSVNGGQSDVPLNTYQLARASSATVSVS